MTGVGQPAGVGALGEAGVDGVVDRHPAQGHVARRHALGEGDQVGHDVEIVDGEPFSGASEAGHHLVGDEHDAVAITDLPHPGHVPGRGDHDARGSRHRLQDDRGDRRRALVGDEALEVVQRPLRFLLLGFGVERRAVQERSVEVDDAGAAVVVRVAAGVAGEVDGGVCAAVIRAVARKHLAPAGVQPGHPDGVLDGVGAGIGEEDMVEVTGGALRDQAGGF